MGRINQSTSLVFKNHIIENEIEFAIKYFKANFEEKLKKLIETRKKMIAVEEKLKILAK